MKKILFALVCWMATKAWGQTAPLPVYCNLVTLAPCVVGSNPGNGTQGDSFFTAFGKINTVIDAFQVPINTSNSFLGYLTFVGVNVAANASLAAYENTFVGWDAGGSGHNTGDGLGGGTGITANALENTCVGWACLTQNTSGQFNTSVGVNSLGHETTGNQNNMFGTDAGRNQVGSSNNVGMGVSACRNGAATNSNICIGNFTLQGVSTFPSTTTGSDNVAIGNNAMAATGMTTANNNVAIGGSAYGAATTGNNNVAIGPFALTSGTSLAGVTALGYEAGFSQSTGNDNTYLGNTAGFNALGNYNTIVGSKAFVGSSGGGGSQNTTVGYQTCNKCTSAAGNVVIGYQVGSTTLTTGATNILIGTSSSIDTPAIGTNNWINIGNVIAGSMSAGSLSSCGTSPSVDTECSDISCTITTGTSATACTYTFAVTKAHTPHCTVTARSGTQPSYTPSTGTLILNSAAASATYDFTCSGY